MLTESKFLEKQTSWCLFIGNQKLYFQGLQTKVIKWNNISAFLALLYPQLAKWGYIVILPSVFPSLPLSDTQGRVISYLLLLLHNWMECKVTFTDCLLHSHCSPFFIFLFKSIRGFTKQNMDLWIICEYGDMRN